MHSGDKYRRTSSKTFNGYVSTMESMAGLGHSSFSKERADFDNTVLELPDVHVVYVNFTRQSGA
jgi:phage head maturation protease